MTFGWLVMVLAAACMGYVVAYVWLLADRLAAGLDVDVDPDPPSGPGPAGPLDNPPSDGWTEWDDLRTQLDAWALEHPELLR